MPTAKKPTKADSKSNSSRKTVDDSTLSDQQASRVKGGRAIIDGDPDEGGPGNPIP